MHGCSRRSFLKGIGVAGVATLGGCMGTRVGGSGQTTWNEAPVGSLSGTWPCLCGDFQRRSFAGDTATTEPEGEVEVLTDKWVTENVQPAIVNGTAYVPVGARASDEETGLAAINLQAGRREWFVETPPIITTPVVLGDVVFSSGHQILAVNRTDGSKYWKRQTETLHPGQSPVVVEDTLVTPDGNTVTVTDGSSADTDGFVPEGGVSEGTRPNQIATNSERTIHSYVGDDAGVTAYDARQGDLQWSLAAGSQVTTPVVSDESVLFVADEYIVASTGLQSSDVNWKRDTVRSSYGSRPALVDETLVLFEEPNLLHGIDSTTGTSEWTTGLEGSWTSPVWLTGTSDSVLVADKDGTLAAVSVDSGAVRWTQELLPDGSEYIANQPIITDLGIVFSGRISIGSNSSTGLIICK